MGSLFGGSSSNSTQTSTFGPVDKTPKEFKALRGPIADAFKGLIGDPLPQAGGDAPLGVAQLTPLEQQLLGQLGANGGGPNPLQTQGRDLLSQTLGGDFLRPQDNPFLADSIKFAQQSVIDQFQNVALPRLQGQFTAAGQRIQPGSSSPFDRAAGIATSGLTNELGRIATDLSARNFESERGRQQEGIGIAENITQQDLTNTVEKLRAAALPRLIEQFGIDQGIQEFNRRIDTILQSLAISSGLPINVIANQGGSTGTSTSTSSPNIPASLIGAFKGGAIA